MTIERLEFIRHHRETAEMQQWLVANGAREEIIDWLVWNDSNGVYTDEDSVAEGYEPLTLQQARDLMGTILRRDNE